jgi:hypothetical protein
MRTLALLVLLVSAPRAALAGPLQGQVEVLSVVGTARAGGKRLEAGAALHAGAVVELVSRDAGVQLVLARRMAVGLCDRASARLLGAGADVVLDQGGVARLAGRGSVVSGRLRAELGADGIVLLQGGRLFVQEGRVTVRSILAPPARPIRTVVHSGEQVSPGRAVRAARSGDLKLRWLEPPAGLVARTLVYQPPPPWDPGEDPVEVGAQVKRTQQRVEARQQRERELATCGCTESSGPGLDPSKERNKTVIEGRRGTVRVRVRGVPRRIQ